MQTSKAASLVNRLDFVATTGSTNADLIAAADTLPDLSVLVADFQSAGKGRAGRDWLAPAGSSLFVSILIKPGENFGPSSFSWLPLLAGLAMQRTVNELLIANLGEDAGARAYLKWPNDVLVATKKISGVLSELVPDLTGVVIGAGLNLNQTLSDLPIEAATSIAIETGKKVNRDLALEIYLRHFAAFYSDFKNASGNAVTCGLRNQVIDACGSIGLPVRVILPGDTERFGKAIGIDDSGRLIVQPENSAEVFAVAAGDIVHLRHNYS